ncbi:MAG: hypothetical protein LBU37_07190 [Tannerellaceae bacterium]|nr:hypothetical protein [Tannerellaceae bacterium]
MKKLFYVFLTIVLLCILFFACTESVVTEGLARAEKLMDVNPDSALALLEEIKKDSGDSLITKTLSKKQYALWRLLLTQAQHKNRITQTSDSLIRVAVDYFEKERMFHARKSQQKTIWICLLTVSIIITFCGGFLFYRRKKRIQKEKHDRELSISEQKYRQGEQFIKEKEEEIRRLKKTYESETDKYQKELLAIRRQILDNELLQSKQKHKLQKESYVEFKKSSTCQLFLSGGKPAGEDWAELEDWMDLIYPDMKPCLTKMSPLVNEEDVRMCFLLKMKVQGKRIGELFNIVESGISRRKERLYKKLTRTDGSAKELDALLAEMFKTIE